MNRSTTATTKAWNRLKRVAEVIFNSSYCVVAPAALMLGLSLF